MQVDNSAALAVIRNQGSTKSWDLSNLTVGILEKANSQGIVIQPVRISLEENHLADLASRCKVFPDRLLNQLVVDKIFQTWGRA